MNICIKIINNFTANKEFISDYKIISSLDKGAFGKIILVEKGNIKFVVKRYNKSSLKSQISYDFENNKYTNNMSKMWNEIEILEFLNRIENNYIIKFYEYYDKNDFEYLYWILEYGDIGQIMKFNYENKIYIFNELICLNLIEIYKNMYNCLNYMHNQLICHLDIKIENFICIKDTESDKTFIKLIDFNTAKIVKENELIYENIGTFLYSSPESLFNINDGYDPILHDLWSLGICFYLLKYKEFPFDSENNDEFTISDLIKNKNLKFDDTQADKLIKILLDKEPNNRSLIKNFLN